VLPIRRVRVLGVSVTTAGTNAVTVGNGSTSSSTAFSSWLGGTNQTVTIRPGGLLLLVAPDATAYPAFTRVMDSDDGAGALKISNGNTNTATVDVWVGGASQ